jgi:hypothetical protein
MSSAHDRLLQLARSQSSLDRELGDALLAAYRQAAHLALGYGSFREYAERFLGWTGRQTEERLRVAFALENLPELRARLESGELHWSAVRELTRVATESTEREWIAEAQARTTRDIERLVSGRELGDRPSDEAPPIAARKHLSLSLSPQAWALWEETREQLTRERGARVDDDQIIIELATRALGGRDTAKSAYQVILATCDRCGRAEQQAGAQRVTVEPHIAEAANCDAQLVTKNRATQTIPPRIRRAVLLRHANRCAVPGCTHSAFVDLHHVKPRAEGGTHDPELLIPLCSAHHMHVHEARLVIRGAYSTGFVFEHADGRRYGSLDASPSRANIIKQAHGALVSMGFKGGEAQRMIDRASPRVGASADLEAIVRGALREVEPSKVTRVSEACEGYVRRPMEWAKPHDWPRCGWYLRSA